MVEIPLVTEEKDEKKDDRMALAGDLLYAAVKGIGGLALKAFTNLEIEGKEKIPLLGKAILTTISKNSMRDMLIISQLTGRKVHFMVDPKLMKHEIAGPVLKTLGMFRSTTSKEDTEPIDKVFEILNQMGDLVAMTPEAKFDREIQVKSIASIIKFAALGKAPIIPLAIYGTETKLFGAIKAKGLKVKVGNPINCPMKLTRDKNRDQRYELAEDIVNIIDTMRTDPDF
ncbi:MAG: lysophospholipid acyltransferase family protein [Promethearchaeota archaeon]